MPDRTCQTRSSFNDNDDINSVVLATISTNAHYLPGRLFPVNHVSTINSSTKFQMRHINSNKTNLSNAVPMARPFDEFATGLTTISNSPFNGQINGITIKSDKD